MHGPSTPKVVDERTKTNAGADKNSFWWKAADLSQPDDLDASGIFDETTYH